MDGTGTKQGLEPVYLADPTVVIFKGCPVNDPVNVEVGGTVQFANTDLVAYKVRFWSRCRHEHADLDVLLGPRGNFTVIVDPDTFPSGECYYELFEVDLKKVPQVEDQEVRPVEKLNAVRAPAAPPAGTSSSGTNASGTSSTANYASAGSKTGGGTIKVGG